MFSALEMHSTMSSENDFVLILTKASRGSSWFVYLLYLLVITENDNDIFHPGSDN